MLDFEFYLEPIISINGELLAFELLSRFFKDGKMLSRPDAIINNMDVNEKHKLIHSQLKCISTKKTYFQKRNIICTLNVDCIIAQLIVDIPYLNSWIVSMPFISLEISEMFDKLEMGIKHPVLSKLVENAIPLWLDDMGSGLTHSGLVRDGIYNVVKLEGSFLKECIRNNILFAVVETFNLNGIRVVAEGVDSSEYLAPLRQANVWGIQGYLYPGLWLKDIEM